MTTRLVFETATFADAIKKAERIAPTRGSAFDKAAGIVIEIELSLMVDPQITVKATDGEVFYMQWVDALEATGASAMWRLPSKLFAGLVASLPLGSGKQIVLEQDGNAIKVTQGKTRAKFYLMTTDYYPVWGPFDESTLVVCSDLGGRLGQVSWCVAENEEKINGVNFNGQRAVATDRYRLVTVPLAMDLPHPITVPAALLAPMLKQTGDVRIGIDGNMFLVAPDEYSQFKTIISGHEYPSVDRLMNRDQPVKINLKKRDLLEIMTRSMHFTGGDRFPNMQLFFGKEEINIFMQDAERGILGDAVELPGQATHDRVRINFTPKNIMEALDRAPNEDVTIGYDPAKPEAALYLDGGSGYEAWIMPRRASEPTQ